VLFNEPKLLKAEGTTQRSVCFVSVLFNEPKLLKLLTFGIIDLGPRGAFQCSSTSRNC